MTKRKPLSKRATALFERIKRGDWYPTYGDNTPKAMQELIDAGLVVVRGRVARIESCFVPRKGFKPYRLERWAE